MKIKNKKKTAQQRKPATVMPVLFIGASLIVLFLVLYNINRPIGQVIPEMGSRIHIEEGKDPGPYNSNPPTSGIHYETSLEAGFYEDNPYEYAEGFLVHSLEHGYVIFWYNCSLLGAEDCQALKIQIRDVMEQAGNYKVIAFPWATIDVPVAMTAWGRLLDMDKFDPEKALAFIEQNRERSPEPAGH